MLPVSSVPCRWPRLCWYFVLVDPPPPAGSANKPIVYHHFACAACLKGHTATPVVLVGGSPTSRVGLCVAAACGLGVLHVVLCTCCCAQRVGASGPFFGYVCHVSPAVVAVTRRCGTGPVAGPVGGRLTVDGGWEVSRRGGAAACCQPVQALQVNSCC